MEAWKDVAARMWDYLDANIPRSTPEVRRTISVFESGCDYDDFVIEVRIEIVNSLSNESTNSLSVDVEHESKYSALLKMIAEDCTRDMNSFCARVKENPSLVGSACESWRTPT